MKLFIIISILFLWCPIYLLSQIKSNVVPFIKNYSPSDYIASDQNWAIVQDKRGVMYFGNNDNGVLEYDGVNWRKIKVANNSIVRSLAIDEKGTIFVGTVGEFGYLSPDASGLLNYISLSCHLDSSDRDFADIWKTYFVNKRIYFCSQGKIFIYDHTLPLQVINTPLYTLFSFFVNGKLFVGNHEQGLMEYRSGKFNVCKGGDFFSLKTIFALIPYNTEQIIVATYEHGVFLYDINTGAVSDRFLSSSANSFLRQSLVYHAIKLPDHFLSFGTLEGGAIITDNKGDIVQQFNKQIGLQDETTIYLYNNSEDYISRLLWIGLNVGISKAEINSPFSIFSEGTGLKGSVYDIIRFNGLLYVSTSSGVFYLSVNDFHSPQFKMVVNTDPFSESGLLSQSWHFTEFRIPGTEQKKLLVATSKGVFEITCDNKAISVENQFSREEDKKKRYNAYKLYISKGKPETVYIGHRGGFAAVHYTQNKWDLQYEIPEVNDEVRGIAEDRLGVVWLATYFNGVYKITITPSDTVVDHFLMDNGLPTVRDITVYNHNNDILFATNKGFYKYLADKDLFCPDFSFGASYCNGLKGIFRYVQDSYKNYWMSISHEDKETHETYYWIEMISQQENGKLVVDSLPFKRLPSKQIDAIYPESNGITWFGISNCLYSYDSGTRKNFQIPYNTLIRSLIIGEDSVLFNGTHYRLSSTGVAQIINDQSENAYPEISYPYRSLTFHFAAPFFEEESKTLYSYFLEGYNQRWSKWSYETYKDFTNLREGNYIFKVKSKNIYGIESRTATFQFSILPPWYRTVWAYIIYCIAGFFIIWMVVRLNVRRLEAEKLHLESIVKERTAEVVRQKEEITDSIHYASYIQKAVLPSEKMLYEHVPDSFIFFRPRDIVSGDFFWLSGNEQQIYIVAADCTGHGVPGAFMSLLGISFLNEIVNISGLPKANEVLNELRRMIIISLKQTGKQDNETKDGMDIALCILNKEKMTLQFSGANNPLYFIRDNELTEIKGDKMPVAIHSRMESFENHEINLKKDDCFYIFSDGYADQFGGPQGKKFKYKQFKELLLSFNGLSMIEQKKIIEKTLDDWRKQPSPSGKEYEQVDDILVMGIRI